MKSSFLIGVIPGDGIGPEVMEAGLAVLAALAKSTPELAFEWRHLPGGAQHYLDTGTAFADFVVDGHRETWPIRSERFRGWLRRRYYESTGSPLGAQTIFSELDLLEARAQFEMTYRIFRTNW